MYIIYDLSTLSPVNGHPNADQVDGAREEEEEGCWTDDWVTNYYAEVPDKQRLQWTKTACIENPAPERSEERVGDSIHHQQSASCNGVQMELGRQEWLKNL